MTVGYWVKATGTRTFRPLIIRNSSWSDYLIIDYGMNGKADRWSIIFKDSGASNEYKKSYPEVKLTVLAYTESNKPPKRIHPDDNVIIRLANDTASFPYPMFFMEESDVFYPNFIKRKKLGAKIFIWDYVVDYKAWPMPRPNLEVIDYNINTYAKEGVYGLFLQSSHYGVGENQGHLRAWVYSKKMWDPSRKMDDLIRDFNYGYFGKAAG